jgi:hypothetical protein
MSLRKILSTPGFDHNMLRLPRSLWSLAMTKKQVAILITQLQKEAKHSVSLNKPNTFFRLNNAFI